MTLGTQEKHDIWLMIKTTAKNLRVTLSRKYLTRSRNQIKATKSLEYMFHYINWRPTSVIKKHCLPSETDFFKTKRVTSTPQTKRKLTHENPTSALARKASKVINQHQEKTPQDDFFLVSYVTKDEEIFFQGFKASPNQEGLTFLVADVNKR